MSTASRGVRGLLGVVSLIVSLMLVSNWWGDYRDSKAAPETPDAQSTTTTETADTPAEEEPAVEASESAADEAETTAPSATKTVVVLVDGLNFRASPSRDAKLIRGLDADTRLTWLATEDGWHKVRDRDGVVGYVSSSGQYTRLEE